MAGAAATVLVVAVAADVVVVPIMVAGIDAAGAGAASAIASYYANAIVVNEIGLFAAGLIIACEGDVPGLLHAIANDPVQAAQILAEVFILHVNIKVAGGSTRRATVPVKLLPPAEQTDQKNLRFKTVGTPTFETSEATSAPVVWVNTKSGIYHPEGSTFFGATKDGKYMTQAQAEAAGYRAAKPGNLDAARLGTAEHARMTDELRQFEGVKLDNGWELRKVERSVGGAKRIDQLWVHDADKKVAVTDYFTGKAEPASHYKKGMNYQFEPEVQELLNKGYKYEYNPVVMPGGKP